MQQKRQEVIAKVRRRSLLSPSLAAIPPLSVSCIDRASTYTDIATQEAYEMLDQQEVMVLDVRTREEYDSAYIPDALPIALSELELRLDEPNASDYILIYCRFGRCSEEAARR